MSTQEMHISAFCANCATNLDKCDKLEAENLQLKKRINVLTRRIQWEQKILATPSENLSDAHKTIALVLPSIVQDAKKRETTDTARDDGLTRVYREEIAKAVGKNVDRVGSNLKQMGENGIIKHDTVKGVKRTPLANGKERIMPDNALFLDVTPSLISAQIEIVEKRNRGNGQKNFICRSCHSVNTRVLKTRIIKEVVCEDCGEVHTYDSSKPEDQAFMNVSEETVEHWEEMYGDVLEETAPTLPLEPITAAPARPCLVCGVESWEWNPTIHSWQCSNKENHQ